jgi:uncharacterized protein YigA (DUF484 family)
MSSTPKIDSALREAILSRPDVILDDKDVMRALIAANERVMGDNIVDMRGIAMDRLELRLDRLEDTHRSVIAAAYENLAGTNLIHRAILRLLEATDFENFVQTLGGEVAETLRVDAARLLLEADHPGPIAGAEALAEVLKTDGHGAIDAYLTQGRGTPARQATLRQIQNASVLLYDEKSDWLRSEACLKLDLGTGSPPALLLLASEDPHMFGPQQGSDLLLFFAGVLERIMRRWLP